MSILGKLLIVLNLLAAGAFAYLTLENYKVRHALTARALQNDVLLAGLPVEPGDTSGSKESDNVPFHFESGGTVIQQISKKDLAKLLPKGGETYGETGETIANQTDEVKRLQQKVMSSSHIPALNAQDPMPRLAALHGYLLNLARSGAERDGVNALFDLRTDRRDMARRDLPYLARTSSQVAALQAVVAIADLGDPQAITPAAVQASRIGTAREAVRQFLLGEVPHGAAGSGDRSEAERKLTNAIVNAMDGKGPKEEISNSTTDKSFEHLAIVAAEPLTDRASAGRAIDALVAYATSKAATPTEKTALTGIATLINPPVNQNLNTEIDAVATNLLNSKFDEAALPALKTNNNSVGEKARKIAHVLYHIDAHRHAARDEAAVSARKAWHERVAAVVGLQEYVRAAEAQASEYAEASTRLLAVITEEQSAFEADYQAQVQRVQLLFTQWLTLDSAFKAQDSITTQNVKLKEQRETERNSLKESLASSILKAKSALEKLTATQKQMFDVQKQLRDAQAALLSLESELRRLEERRETGRK
jgi:hypothetical protein